MRAMQVDPAVPEDITLLLVDARKGSAHAQERLYAHVYRELHRLAERQLRGDRQHGGATSLVHEAYCKLSRASTPFNDRQHFFATAARAMRQILIDRARERMTERRGGGVRPQTLDGVAMEVSVGGHDDELLALNQALDQLGQLDPRLAQVVKCAFSGAWNSPKLRLCWKSPNAPSNAIGAAPVRFSTKPSEPAARSKIRASEAGPKLPTPVEKDSTRRPLRRSREKTRENESKSLSAIEALR